MAANFLAIKVRPNARHSTLEQSGDGTWKARLKSPPVEGRANDELLTLVARHFGLPKSKVSITSGAAGRIKRVRIEDV